jgi:hypothetical protein
MVGLDSHWSLPSPEILRCPAEKFFISNTRLSLSMVSYSTLFFYKKFSLMRDPTTPKINLWFGLIPVRSSLTKGLSFDFFSSAYLDISVQQVPSPLLESSGVQVFTYLGVSPFGHHRIIAFCQLPGDFRGLKTSFVGSNCQGIH